MCVGDWSSDVCSSDLFHTFFRRGGYRAMVFAPLRCPKLFRFPFACLWAALSNCFAHRFISSGTAYAISGHFYDRTHTPLPETPVDRAALSGQKSGFRQTGSVHAVDCCDPQELYPSHKKDFTRGPLTRGPWASSCYRMIIEHLDRKSTRLNSSHRHTSRMPSSA